MFIFFSTSSSKKHVREFLETRTTFSKNTYEFFGKYNDVFYNKDYHQTCLSFSYVNMRSSSPLVKSFNNKRALSGTFV